MILHSGKRVTTDLSTSTFKWESDLIHVIWTWYDMYYRNVVYIKGKQRIGGLQKPVLTFYISGDVGATGMCICNACDGLTIELWSLIYVKLLSTFDECCSTDIKVFVCVVFSVNDRFSPHSQNLLINDCKHWWFLPMELIWKRFWFK